MDWEVLLFKMLGLKDRLQVGHREKENGGEVYRYIRLYKEVALGLESTKLPEYPDSA